MNRKKLNKSTRRMIGMYKELLEILDSLPSKLSPFMPILTEIGQQVKEFPDRVAERINEEGHTMSEKMKAIRFTSTNSKVIMSAAPSIEKIN